MSNWKHFVLSKCAYQTKQKHETSKFWKLVTHIKYKTPDKKSIHSARVFLRHNGFTEHPIKSFHHHKNNHVYSFTIIPNHVNNQVHSNVEIVNETHTFCTLMEKFELQKVACPKKSKDPFVLEIEKSRTTCGSIFYKKSLAKMNILIMMVEIINDESFTKDRSSTKKSTTVFSIVATWKLNSSKQHVQRVLDLVQQTKNQFDF